MSDIDGPFVITAFGEDGICRWTYFVDGVWGLVDNRFAATLWATRRAAQQAMDRAPKQVRYTGKIELAPKVPNVRPCQQAREGEGT